MTFRFERLEVWQLARKFAVNAYQITRTYPKEEKFALIDQLRRAAVSVALNIAEGSDRKSDKDFVRFLRMAIGSTEEVVTGLFIAKDLNYFTDSQFNKIYNDANMIVLKINALIKSLKKQ